MTVWQFLAIVVGLVLIYLVYHYWWVDQERSDWIRGMNNWIFHAEQSDLKKNEPKPKSSDSDWGD